jgi:hypothetical protein
MWGIKKARTRFEQRKSSLPQTRAFISDTLLAPLNRVLGAVFEDDWHWNLEVLDGLMASLHADGSGGGRTLAEAHRPTRPACGR